MKVSVLWVARSTNAKTGDVPTAWIGGSRKESLASCEGCQLLAERRCYAQFGSPSFGHASLVKAANRGLDRSLKAALEKRAKTAKMVRIGAIGEPGRLPKSWWTKVRAIVEKTGLDVVAYTHMWRTKPELAGLTMASCDELPEADEALAMGFRAAVVLPSDFSEARFTTPGGAKGIVCPAIRAKGKVTCNDCRLCDGAKPGPVIGFPDHGPRSRRKKMPEKKYYRQVFMVEIVGEVPLDNPECDQLHYHMVEGAYSGQIEESIREQVSAEEAAKLLEKHGSEPAFLLGGEEPEGEE